MRSDEEHFDVITQPEDFAAVRQALEAQGLKIADAAYTMEPTDTVALDSKDAAVMLRLMERLEEDDDVQNVHANFDISDEILAEVS